MKFQMDGPALFDFWVLAACWIGFGVILVIGKRRGAKTDTKRNPISAAGFALQGLGYWICFGFPRKDLAPIVPMPKVTEIILAVTIAAMAIVSLCICYTAARTLGKQWALVARVTEGHELITEGPYAHVRNPIYLAMFGMLVATGLTVSRWQALLAAILIFLIGNEIRIRSEESLLREAFGAKFDEYAARVPAMFPRIL
ncbi:MAG TPA: isoprenylcysteine carboxylmethyltransferase family protein [Candidatus Acidoferrales bacterium]|jgi:protein-S-isoprenylcysteine O-methyltransferase Ste14|nr:isoprenylcysteine carboxylmethyltransferase family protein [Candidatus Acidoferrales bacterium]